MYLHGYIKMADETILSHMARLNTATGENTALQPAPSSQPIPKYHIINFSRVTRLRTPLNAHSSVVTDNLYI
jgi:hypothetical protein